VRGHGTLNHVSRVLLRLNAAPRPAQLGRDYIRPVLVAGGKLPHVRRARFAQNGTPQRTTECGQQAVEWPGPFWDRHGAAPQYGLILILVAGRFR